jgi:hypothetical protein
MISYFRSEMDIILINKKKKKGVRWGRMNIKLWELVFCFEALKKLLIKLIKKKKTSELLSRKVL